MDDFQTIRTERPASGVARIVLARPEKRNAQSVRMIYELNAAFDAAMRDDDVKVLVLAADGPDFSSGHDLRDDSRVTDFDPVGPWGGFDLPGLEGPVATEQEVYLGLCWRWRDLPKPTIAQVQGRVIAAGLMLVWPCDLIVASDDATFSDPLTAFGVNGHEFFVHVWELGARRAKELLFLGETLTAEEAHRIGMVTRVVPRDELEAATLAIAERIAARPSMAIKLAKQSVNASLDVQGIRTAAQQAFWLHHLGHAHNRLVHGTGIDPNGPAIVREASKSRGS